MSYFTEWIMQIIIFLLFMTIIEMLLPSGTTKKYTKVIMSLLLISLILSPLYTFFTSDVEKILSDIYQSERSSQNAEVEKTFEMKKKEIQASLRAYTLEQLSVQMNELVEEELIAQFNLKIDEIDIEIEGDLVAVDQIAAITVYLREVEEDGLIAPVALVNISPSLEKNRQSLAEEKQVAQVLADQWEVSEQIIDVLIEGG
ncbi:stage III sporulation protein AF [Bacillus chungangensis]|uniref:Stage III sporulation protein AF n=1 Tax=Bacillus chungangensis TaxID=587633 RepID=A0ABT9WPN5_9BACI|nr:stage III sporulation protein AF [Bacillus chungangensis]MDQ0175141.1 stage III sporulation protein AF [Bacillus chungangensis]